MSHLLKHLGLWEERPQFLPHWPAEPVGDRRVMVNAGLVREFASYYRGNGRDWRGLEFGGMSSAPMDAEGARLAGILERCTWKQRHKIHNRAVREVMG